MGRYEEAIKDYDKAIDLYPNDAKFYSNRGLSRFSMGRYQEAIQDFNKALEINPNFMQAKELREKSLVALEEANKS